jgi:polysaccharide pyruvyl transferase WcaK-like protein
MRDHDVRVVGGAAAARGGLRGPSIARGLRRADAVVIGGATLAAPRRSPILGRAPIPACSAMSLRSTALVVAAARLRNIPVALVGAGAGELRGSTSRALSRWVVPRADLLVLRDEESAAVLTDAGVPPPFWIGADPAWTALRELARPSALPRSASTAPPSAPRATVVGAQLPAVAGRGRPAGPPFDQVGDALDELQRCGWDVRLLPWRSSSGVDPRCGSAVASGSAPLDLRSAVAALAGDELVISPHPHAVMAAAAAGCRIVALGAGPHLTGLARQLGQVSVPVHAAPAVVRSAVRWAIDNDPPAATAVAGQIELADRTLRLLQLLLEDGRLERPSELPALRLSDGAGRW